MLISIKTQVYCSVHIEGIHSWPECPFEEVNYLRVPHRHIFHIKAYTWVTHSNRDVEFIMLKHKIQQYFTDRYYNDTYKCCYFGAKSCEMIAEELIGQFSLSQCEVSEDGENGAIVITNTIQED